MNSNDQDQNAPPGQQSQILEHRAAYCPTLITVNLPSQPSKATRHERGCQVGLPCREILKVGRPFVADSVKGQLQLPTRPPPTALEAGQSQFCIGGHS